MAFACDSRCPVLLYYSDKTGEMRLRSRSLAPAGTGYRWRPLVPQPYSLRGASMYPNFTNHADKTNAWGGSCNQALAPAGEEGEVHSSHHETARTEMNKE